VPQDCLEDRILICAPFGRDAALISDTLSKEGICAQTVDNIFLLCKEIECGAAAAVISEESLNREGILRLSLALQDQEPWSDLPIIILTTGGDGQRTWISLRTLDNIANVTLLERPLRPVTLVSAVQVSLRSRRRQYQMRSMNAELEHRVAERTAELRRLIEEAEGFSYTISHDLRGPLRAIVSSSHILLEDFGDRLPPAAKDELKIQERAANNMAALIDDLLHLSRLSREKLRAEDLDLSGMVTDLARQLARDGQTALCDFDIQEEVTGKGDPTLIRIALLNLLQNACKFSSGHGKVCFGRRSDGSYFVRDDGIGFDQKYAEKMFLPFERLVTSAEYPGTGIGLANVRRIIERHGGKVWAESAGANQGASFYFTLAA